MDYRKHQAWEEAIKLSMQVHSLIESLPTGEQSALAVSLNHSVVSVPTSVAMDLLQEKPANIESVISLQNQIELVNRIYPALESIDVERGASELLARLQDESRWRELIPEPATASVPTDDEDEEVHAVEPTESVEPSPASSQSTSVPVQPEA